MAYSPLPSPTTASPVNTISHGPSSPTGTTSGYYDIIQLYNSSSYYTFSKSQLLGSPFHELCPSGNCILDCENSTRLFQAVPSGIAADPSTYGRPREDGQVDLTLFGLCSNLANVSSLAATDPNYRSLFSAVDTVGNIGKVTANIAACFSNTCDKTRDPTQCADICSPAKLLSSSNTLDIKTATFSCVRNLCANTCGLPYANQDVFGVGILVSYFVQALLLFLCAAVLLGSGAWQTWRHPRENPEAKEKFKGSLETFLTVQCYFGITTSMAAFVMNPQTIDPLNGYALVSVAISGFLPPIFTLMLLHSHNIKSWFSTLLVFVTWLISSVLFFMLIHNLSMSANTNSSFDEGLKRLFQVSSCGGSSAMSLCQQIYGSSPLWYLNGFYNQQAIPNIKSVPVIWGWTTLVLLILSINQLRGSDHTVVTKFQSETAKNAMRFQLFPQAVKFTQLTFSKFLAVFIASIIFGLALGYQFTMVMQYKKMDVIDWKGWTFGQVVAVLFWVPPLLDLSHSLTENINSSEATSSIPVESSEDESTDSLGHLQPQSPQSNQHNQSDIQTSHFLQRRRTVRMEEGQE